MTKLYLFESTSRNSGEASEIEMREERIAKQFPSALDLGVGESMTLTEEEAGYTDFQNFYETIIRIE
jgi:hypothetical protein